VPEGRAISGEPNKERKRKVIMMNVKDKGKKE
jgi:hypothetical protein